MNRSSPSSVLIQYERNQPKWVFFYILSSYIKCTFLSPSTQTGPLAQGQEGPTDSRSDRGQNRPAAAYRGVQPHDRVLRLLRELPGVQRDAPVPAMLCLRARQPWRLWQLWRKRLPVSQVQVANQ